MSLRCQCVVTAPNLFSSHNLLIFLTVFIFFWACICWQDTWVRQAGSAPTGNVMIPALAAPDCSYTPINTPDITELASHWSGPELTWNLGLWLVESGNRFWPGPKSHLLPGPGELPGRLWTTLNNSFLYFCGKIHHFCHFINKPQINSRHRYFFNRFTFLRKRHLNL